MRVSVGIDPGKKGAVAILTPRTNAVFRTPVNGSEHDVRGMTRALDKALFEYAPARLDVVFAVEQSPNIYVGASKTSTRGIKGVSFSEGIWVGIIGAIGFREVLRPTPKQWQSIVNRTKDAKGDAVRFCKTFLPEIGLRPGKCSKPHTGIADAACIAAWALLIGGYVSETDEEQMDRVARYIELNPGCKRGDISDGTAIPGIALSRCLLRLRFCGRIGVLGSGRVAKWFPAESAKE